MTQVFFTSFFFTSSKNKKKTKEDDEATFLIESLKTYKISHLTRVILYVSSTSKY